MAELDAGSPYEHCKRLTDVHRLQLFDVVMQFRAIFADDASPADDAVARAGGASSGAAASRPEEADGGAVYSWAQHRMCAPLETL